MRTRRRSERSGSGGGQGGQFLIPDSVTEIGMNTFLGLSLLTEINIPDSVTEIEDDAFSDCSALEKVYAPKHLDLSRSGISADKIIRY